MRLKASFGRGASSVDLAVTTDATATIGEVARALARSDPERRGAEPGGVTLRAVDPLRGAPRLLEPGVTLSESALLSGSRIEVAPAPAHPVRPTGTVRAVVRVIEGPDAGREFPLARGSAVVGRDRDVDVRLSDPLVSKRHARLNLADAVEIVDLNSANGIAVGGETVERARLAGGERVSLGDSVLGVVLLSLSDEAGAAPQVDHVRSPRVVPAYPGSELVAPSPPRVSEPTRLPYLALVAPLLIGAVLFVLTQQLLGVVMMAMSPLLLVAGYVDQSITTRRRTKAQRKAFDAAADMLETRMAEAKVVERTARRSELPSSLELADAVRSVGPLVWTERPESPTFLVLDVGTGRDTSRNRLVLPAANDTLPECWARLERMAEDLSTIDGVPLAVELRRDGSLGVAGETASRTDVARSLMLQLLARHAPADVVVGAIVAPARRAEWEWLKWAPHTSTSHSPVGQALLADSPAAVAALIAELEGLVDPRTDPAVAHRDDATPVVPAVVVVVDHPSPPERARLTRVMERGVEAGIHVVWVADRQADLPAACRTVVAVAPEGGTVGSVRRGQVLAPVVVSRLDAATADALARVLAPVIDVGVPERDDSDLPRSVSFPALVGQDVLDLPADVIDRWTQNDSLLDRVGPAVERRRDATLRAIVGSAGAQPLALDLRTDGPHALVGGTTGAGKSEFLQAWVLGMATAHSPDRLTFLFVDYKGGSAFADCTRLPHTVGLVTDLSPHLVRRALTSLRAELRHREHVLNAKGKKDIATLERSGDPECPPSLVIVVDEFAALAQEVPEFVDGVVDVAQRGRSLGLHLILATQRPSGVIRDNLRANTNLRIALRMADADDSIDILGERTAAFFDPSTPGRGAVKSGPGRLRTFQSGYAGGRTAATPPPPRIDIDELGFGGVRWEAPGDGGAVAPESGPSDIARIVDTVGAAARSLDLPEPRRPWLDELAAVYRFDRLPNPRTDDRLLLGVIDDPDEQKQPTAFWQPDRDGSLAVFGTGGSGKSTLLRTLAVAAAATRNGGPVHVYGLDFGSRGLALLEDLPHVGAIVQGDDEERVVRTIRMLRGLVEERAERYTAAKADSIGAYRRIAGRPEEPRVLLLVDGIGAFKEQYEFGPAHLSPWFTAFAQIAADGRAFGVHIVVAGDRPNSLPTSIASTVQRRIVLRMANDDEYLNLGVPRDVLGPTSPPGRGLFGDSEIQIALLGESGNVAVQSRELSRLGASMRRRPTGPPPAPVERLADRVALAELPAGDPGEPVIGVADATLAPFAFPATGTLLIAGPPGSGRTTALVTLSKALARSDPHVRRVLLSPRRSVTSRADWHEVAEGPDAVQALAARLADLLDADAQPSHALFLEGVPEFTATAAEYDLERLVRVAARQGHLVVGEGESSTWQQAYQLAAPFKAGRRGLLLAPGEMDGDTLFGTSLGRIRRSDFYPGRGFFIAGGRTVKLQTAEPGW